ncbi:MAG: efflux RND transporter periplasmic adaptor subunit [Gemmatimonadales bacterium]
MDIVRTPPKHRRRYFIIALAVVAVISVTISVSRLESRAPSVERGTLWIDTVRRGTMLRQVRAPGKLEPEHVRFVSAVTAGRVERRDVLPGAHISPTTVLVELSNPDVQYQALTAQQQLADAKATLVNTQTQLESQRLTESSQLATVQSDSAEAARNAAMMDALDKKGFAGGMELAKAHDKLRELDSRLSTERDHLHLLTESVSRQLVLQQQQIQRLQAIAQFQEDRVASMRVVAGDSGVLQESSLDLGQWVVPGQILAKVAQPGKLKALLNVPETQVVDVTVGEVVSVDTRNGVVPGRVVRIAPAAQNGTVEVEVSLPGTLPAGARADLSVDGTIEVERLENVLYVGRPAFAQNNLTVGVFKLDPNGNTAARVPVTFGRASVTTIEIRQGLSAGDHVIISDMSAWDNVNKVRIE